MRRTFCRKAESEGGYVRDDTCEGEASVIPVGHKRSTEETMGESRNEGVIASRYAGALKMSFVCEGVCC